MSVDVVFFKRLKAAHASLTEKARQITSILSDLAKILANVVGFLSDLIDSE